MKTIRNNPGVRRWKQRAGGTLVMVTIFAVALFAFAALSIDVARVKQEQRHIQYGADAGSYAGVLLLGSTTLSTNDAIEEARLIANANGITDAEVAAGARNGLPGAIQAGLWTNKVFTPGAVPYNAVRVPARREVDLVFARVIGMGGMKPAVHSVAVVGARGIPVGVRQSDVDNALQNNNGMLLLDGQTTGNWGPLQICDERLAGQPSVRRAIREGDCFISLRDVATRPGFAGVRQGFGDRCQAGGDALTFVMPVIAGDWPPGVSDPVEVVDVILVELQCPISGGGHTFQAQVRIVGTGFIGVSPFIDRAWVQSN